MRITVRDLSRKVNDLGKVRMLKSPKRNTLEDGLIERTSSMLDEIESKTKHNNKEGD